jgi:large subunit ribosomal protein L21
MYAIIDIGGKQAKVAKGDVVSVERIPEAGETVTFTPLLVVDKDGQAVTDKDRLASSTVTATVQGEEKGKKIDIFTYKNKTGNRRRRGHRQTYTTVEVTDIDLG